MASQTQKTVLISSNGKKINTDNQSNTTEKKPKAKKRIKAIAVIIAILAGIYCTAIFTDIPFIKKYRDLYIETAMDTMTHKWLATFFIPKYIIDEVEANKADFIAQQQNYESYWSPKTVNVGPIDIVDRASLLKEFNEIDAATFDAYISEHPDVLKNGYAKLLINKAGLKDGGTSIKTTNGDQVLAIDAENSLMIIKVTGDGFVGKMALIKNPLKVKVGVASTIGSAGQFVGKIADENNAILAINASGFADYKGVGNGGSVVGLLIANGQKISDPVKNGYLNIGFDEKDHLYIGAPTSQIKYRDAIEFIPAMIINGQNVISDPAKSGFFGIQPRTAMGQEKDGTILLLTIDGRQVGYSTGATIGNCEDIMLKYDAVQAANLDGGSSTVMVYRGQVITKPANNNHYGRYVPDAIIVEYTGAHEQSKPATNNKPKPSPSPTPSPSPSPTDQTSPSPSDQTSPTPTDQVSPSPIDQASPSPTDQASPSPSPLPSIPAST